MIHDHIKDSFYKCHKGPFCLSCLHERSRGKTTIKSRSHTKPKTWKVTQ